MSLSSLKLKWILIGLLLISLVMPAMAESGTLGTSGSNNLTTSTLSINVGVYNVSGLYTVNIEELSGMTSVIDTCTGTADITSNSTTVNLYIGAEIVGNGTFGYNYNSGPGLYNLFFITSTLNFGARTGAYYINFTPLTFGNPGMWQLSNLKVTKTATGGATDNMHFGSAAAYIMYGAYQTNRQSTFYNHYDFNLTTPLSQVNVIKLVSGSLYSSRVYIYSGDTVLASEAATNTNNYSGTFYQLPIKIAILDRYARWWNTSSMGLGTLAYNISLVPTNISPTESSTGTITSTSDPWLASITAVSWSWSDSTGGAIFSDGLGTGNITQYTKQGTAWYGYNVSSNSFNVNKGTAIPNPVALYGSVMGGTGAKTITCLIATSDGNYYVLTTSLTVGGANQYTTTYAAAIDYSTGAYIDDATVAFQNVATSAWYSNVTTGGQNQISSPPGIYLNIVATAPGYGTITRSAVTASQLNQTPMYYELGMFPVTNITGSAYTTFYVSVTDKESGQAIDMASVFVYNTSFQWYHNTGTNGIATFSVYNQTLYRVTASKSGYNSLSKYVTVLSGTVATTDIELSHFPIAVTTTAFPTVAIPTTPIPGYTPGTGAGGGGGNFTGFWAPFQNAAIAMGATPSSVGILVAMFLTFCGLIVGFSVGGIPGGEMGGILGLIFSVAFGFFPLAIAIVTVVGLIAYVSLRFWGMTH